MICCCHTLCFGCQRFLSLSIAAACSPSPGLVSRVFALHGCFCRDSQVSVPFVLGFAFSLALSLSHTCFLTHCLRLVPTSLSLSTASSLASSNASASGSATTRNPTAIPRTSSGEFGGGNEFVFAFLFPPSPARLGLRLSPLISLSPLLLSKTATTTRCSRGSSPSKSSRRPTATGRTSGWVGPQTT